MAITNQIATLGYGPGYSQVVTFGYGLGAAVPDYLGVPVLAVLHNRYTEAADPPALAVRVRGRSTRADIREAPD